MKSKGELEFNGKTFSWSVDRETLAVSHPSLGRKFAKIDPRLAPEGLAQILARELMDDARNKGLLD